MISPFRLFADYLMGVFDWDHKIKRIFLLFATQMPFRQTMSKQSGYYDWTKRA